MHTFDTFVRDLQNISRAMQTDQEPLLQAANYLIDHLPPEPLGHKASGRENQWDSEKQRGWYYWMVRTGQLKNPYQRTHRLENSFVTSPLRVLPRGAEITVASNYPKSIFVIGDPGVPAEQAAVHEGRWWSFDEEVSFMREDVENLMLTVAASNLAQIWG